MLSVKDESWDVLGAQMSKSFIFCSILTWACRQGRTTHVYGVCIYAHIYVDTHSKVHTHVCVCEMVSLNM